MLLNGKWLDASSYKINSANGDGSATAFGLSHTPASLNTLAVFVDGLKMIATIEYSLSNKTVTFVTAPNNAQKVEFNYISKD